MENEDVKMLKIMEWTRLIQAANESSMSREQWCKSNNISESAFYYWQRRVRAHALESIPKNSAPKTFQQDPDFYEISIPAGKDFKGDVAAADYPAGPHEVVNSTGLITIRSGKFEIDVRDSFSRQALKCILEVIKNV